MDLNSNINKKSNLIKYDDRKYYEVKNIDGNRYCQCGSEKDAQMLCNMNPGFTYSVHLLPPVPKTVNVPHVRLDDDLQLPAQQILNPSKLEPFIV